MTSRLIAAEACSICWNSCVLPITLAASRNSLHTSSSLTIVRTMLPSMTSVSSQISSKGVPHAHSYTTCARINHHQHAHKHLIICCAACKACIRSHSALPLQKCHTHGMSVSGHTYHTDVNLACPLHQIDTPCARTAVQRCNTHTKRLQSVKKVHKCYYTLSHVVKYCYVSLAYTDSCCYVTLPRLRCVRGTSALDMRLEYAMQGTNTAGTSSIQQSLCALQHGLFTAKLHLHKTRLTAPLTKP